MSNDEVTITPDAVGALPQSINEMRTMRESYDQLVSQNAQLAANVQAIKEAHILSFNYDGLIFVQGFEPRSAFGVVANRNELVEIHDELDTRIPAMLAAEYPQLEVFEMKSATEWVNSFLKGSDSIKKIIMPRLYSQAYGFWEVVQGMPNLVYLDMEYVDVASNNYSIYLVPRLIDIVFGKSKKRNAQELRLWDPQIALQSNTQSLLTEEDIIAGFTSNLEKLLYNIREHIAANLPTITEGYSITFSAAVKAAVLADQETADAFTNKGWTIA